VQVPRNDAELEAEIIQRELSGGPAAAVAYCREVLDAPKLPKGSTRAALLVHVGEYSQMAGDVEAAGEAFRAAVADGGHAAPDARCYLAGWQLEHGDSIEGQRLIAQMWEERPTDPDVYQFVGELAEGQDEFAAAAKWFTAGALRALEHDRTSSGPVALLLLARRRVRQVQGLPEDDYDEIAEQMRTGTYVDPVADVDP
jgi:predicted Zn-dependent protease